MIDLICSVCKNVTLPSYMMICISVNSCVKYTPLTCWPLSCLLHHLFNFFRTSHTHTHTENVIPKSRKPSGARQKGSENRMAVSFLIGSLKRAVQREQRCGSAVYCGVIYPGISYIGYLNIPFRLIV